MEFKINEYQLPAELTFNYEELKQELTEKVNMYKTLVYTENQVKDAKADRATLNKLKTALKDERIRLEKEYMKPFDDFKTKVAEIIKIIDEPIAIIDTQVKEFEDKKKAEKLELVKKLWDETEKPDGLPFEKVFDEKMLNVSYNMGHVKQKFADDISRYLRDIKTLENLPEFGFEAIEVYKTTFDINKAIAEAQNMARIAKAKAERDAQLKAIEQNKIEQPTPKPVVKQPEIKPAQNKTWVKMAAYMTLDEARELKKFFDDRAIEFKAI